MEDLVHKIHTVKPNFKRANNKMLRRNSILYGDFIHKAMLYALPQFLLCNNITCSSYKLAVRFHS